MAETVEFAGREFARGCRIELLDLLPHGSGVELAPLAPDLHALTSNWAPKLRRPLVALDGHDANVLKAALVSAGSVEPSEKVVAPYSLWWDARTANPRRRP